MAGRLWESSGLLFFFKFILSNLGKVGIAEITPFVFAIGQTVIVISTSSGIPTWRAAARPSSASAFAV
jgi:hypothetical protein